MKKYLVLVLTVIMVFAMTATVSADANANWDAAKGTATVDGQKDDAYAAAQEIKMDAVSDGETDGTTASAWAVYDDAAVYVIVEVADSELDDLSPNAWEKDSVEFRFVSNDQSSMGMAVDESVVGPATETKVLKTDKGYNVEFKVEYAATEGNSVKFSLQVNAASGGVRNCTLHTNDDLKDVWQNNEVMENLVFSAATAEAAAEEVVVEEAEEVVADDTTTEAPKTGVVSLGLFFGMGAVATAAGAAFSKGKKKN